MGIIEDHSRQIERLRFMDDKFMKVCFKNHPEIVEMILRIIFKTDKIKVSNSFFQDHIANINGKDVILDIVSEDTTGSIYDIEVQRKKEGANVKRLRYIGARLDSLSLDVNQEYKDLSDTYIIFITENDFFNKGKQVYHISKVVEETGEKIDDGLHYMYINASYKSDDDLGKVCHDFLCADTKEMEIPELRKLAEHYKYSKGGKEEMSPVFEEVKEEGKAEGREEMVVSLVNDGTLTIEKGAEKLGITADELREKL